MVPNLRTKRARILLSALPLLLVGLLPAITCAQVSLNTVVDLAQRNSTGVRAATADVNKAAAVLSQSKDVIIPTITFETGLPVFPEVGFTGNPPSIWSATVQSLVYSIPQKRYIDAANLGVQAARTRLRDAREQVALDASTAYIELDTVNQESAEALQQEQFAARLVNIEEQRTEAGVDPLSAYLQAKLRVAEIKLNRIHLETRAANLDKELSVLTGLPQGSIKVDHASIPEIPQIDGNTARHMNKGVVAAQMIADSKTFQARGDRLANYLPEMRFAVQYLRNTTILNDVNKFFAQPLPANNFASGISVQVPLLDMGRYARARESAADALRARIEAEQAEKQSDLAVVNLSSAIRELDVQAEIASLKQQIAADQLKSVLTELEVGNGSGVGPGSVSQVSPKMAEEARIDASQKAQDSLDAGFELSKSRLNLLRALGHMDDWLKELRGR